jgi:hypothetical protein
MAATYLASAALMGLFVAVVLVALARGPGWYQYAPRAAGEGGGWPRSRPTAPGLLARPVTWLVAFVVTALIAVVGVFAIVTDPGPLALTDPPVLAVGGLALVYVVLGSYLAGRDRGFSHALALGVASVVIGFLFLAGVLLQLLT